MHCCTSVAYATVHDSNHAAGQGSLRADMTAGKLVICIAADDRHIRSCVEAIIQHDKEPSAAIDQQHLLLQL